MRRLILVASMLASFGVFASQGSEFSKLTPHEALDEANAMFRTGEASIQVKPTKIVGQFKDGSLGAVPLEKEFLVSIAPYLNKMHPCDMHLPTGCTGELQNEKMGVTVYDKDSHRQLLFKMAKANPNGFIDLWLPRDREHLEIIVNYKGKKATKVIGTSIMDNTCITDMKLESVS